ncbi:hypothetical protein HaLaN_28528 [Haematococcus lacustris]|uniref:Uncharacterized protein n=1 Tax=Haematococcus lacustris TaxID=44745 RepID=A0A6A0AC19_HAELA|nr:hypothetical protein HaLaN_28528 [Haematococcus lacustris]
MARQTDVTTPLHPCSETYKATALLDRSAGQCVASVGHDKTLQLGLQPPLHDLLLVEAKPLVCKVKTSTPSMASLWLRMDMSSSRPGSYINMPVPCLSSCSRDSTWALDTEQAR